MDEHHRQAAARAIRALRQRVRWKPNKEAQHLEKRKRMGHLPSGATLDDYDTLLRRVLEQADSLVYHYPFGAADYYAASADIEGTAWLVIFGADGVMETAFPPTDLADYLTRRGFMRLGTMEEVLHA